MDFKAKDFNESQSIAKSISGLLVLMYGFVPLTLNSLGIYNIVWAESNFIYSLCLFIIVLTLPNYKFKTYFFRFDFKTNYLWKTFLLFSIAITYFSLWSWSDDRVSPGEDKALSLELNSAFHLAIMW